MTALDRIPAQIRWFLTAWRDPGRRRAAATGYGVLRERPLTLADIALRGSVFGPTGGRDAVELARAEGRRELALEIIRLAGADPGQLLRLIEQYEPQPKDMSR